MKKQFIQYLILISFVGLLLAVFFLSPQSASAVFDKKNGDPCPGQTGEWTWECPDPAAKGTCGGGDCIGYNLKCVGGVWTDQSVGAGVCTNECGTCSGGSSSSSCQNPSGNEGDTRYDCSPATAASCASDACVGIPKRCEDGQWVSTNNSGECTTVCSNCSHTSPTIRPTIRPTVRPTTGSVPRPTSGGGAPRATSTTAPGGGSCPLNSYTITDSCSSCIISKDSNLPANVKNLGSQNGQNWSSCSDNKLVAKWCGDINKKDCDSLKSNECKDECSGTSPSPTTAPSSVTTHYRISETSFSRYNESDNDPEWIPYTNNDDSEVVSLTYQLKEPAPGQEFTIFVQFKDDSQTENSKKYSVVEHRTIKFIGGDPVISSTTCGFDPSGDGTLVTLIGSNFGNHSDQGSGEVKINGQSAEIISWTDEAPAATPTPTPTLAPFTWKINAEAVCSNGGTPKGDARLFYTVWPPNPLTWKYDENTASGIKHTQLITTTTTTNQAVYVGLEDAQEQALQPVGTPPNSAITYAQYFDPLAWMAKWQQDQLPSGEYNLQFKAPDSWCTLLTQANNVSAVLGARTTNSRVVAKVKSKLAGRIPLHLKLDDGRTATATCTVNTTTVEFTAKVSCRMSGDFSVSDVDIAVTEATSGAKPIIKTKVKLDKGGNLPADFVPVLEKAKKYNLLVKAPKTVARKVEFTTQDGSNILSNIILPIGDIAPAGNADGKINALDKSELVREWSTSGDTAKPGDFNLDGRVNSMDWSCMRENINKEDEGTL